jgi:hypothetical protein
LKRDGELAEFKSLKDEIMSSDNSMRREVLLIPDRKPVILTTYEAKDADIVLPSLPGGAPRA